MPMHALTVVLLGGLLMAGCTASRPDTLLFDGSHPLKTMPHVSIVDDPFATTQPDSPAEKVLQGGPLKGEQYQNKGTFVRDSHFIMPADGHAELVAIVAMSRLTDLKIEITAKDPAGSQKFRKTLPDLVGWQEVIVPIDPAKIKPGSNVYDITLFQAGNDPAAKFYIHSVCLRTR